MERIVKFSDDEINQISVVYRDAVGNINPYEVNEFLEAHGCESEADIEEKFSQDDWSEEDFDAYNRIFEPAVELEFDMSDEVENEAFSEWENADGDFDKSIELFNKYGAINDSEKWQAMRKALLCISITGW